MPHVSMAEVAAAAGVSQQTVSRVVNGCANVRDDTRRRVQDVMRDLGFRPNYAGRSLRGGRYRSVGLCLRDLSQVGDLAVLDGLAAAARAHGYAVTLVELRREEPPALAEASRIMAELPVDGMVLGLSRITPDFESFRPHPGISTVLISTCAHPWCTTVDSDNYECSLLVMNHLMGLGHSQIRFVGGPESTMSVRFREAGWRDEMVRAGFEIVEPLHGDWGAPSGYEIGRILARDARMTAVLVANDQMAVGVIEALREAGRSVPEDVSVVGIDDSLGAYVPRNELTTVRFDLRRCGQEAFNCAVLEPGEQARPRAIRVPGTLIVRSTTAPVRSGAAR